MKEYILIKNENSIYEEIIFTSISKRKTYEKALEIRECQGDIEMIKIKNGKQVGKSIII